MDFKFPITVIAGRNGAGKSTILAMAACAYHLEEVGFNPMARNKSYYTFNDFFVQSAGETKPGGIVIRYGFMFDGWSNAEPGFGQQFMKRAHGGKWTNYAKRLSRRVVYLGMERVVPHYERSASRNYSARFADVPTAGWEEKAKGHVERILGQKYNRLWFRAHERHRLPVGERAGMTFSGLNMGAGENALFAMFAIICAYPESLLLLVDEIELGLHEEAQFRLIEELKAICKQQDLQVICTTHSRRVLDSLPPASRFLLERRAGKTVVSAGIASSFAAAVLGADASQELTLFVEDGVAADLVLSMLDVDLRRRVGVYPIGSHSAVMRQLAARFKERERMPEVLGVLDGDQRSSLSDCESLFLSAIETPALREPARLWLSDRLAFLPGDEWPEKWLLEKCCSAGESQISLHSGVAPDEVVEAIEDALRAGKHSEFFRLGELLQLEITFLRRLAAATASALDPDATAAMQAAVRKLLAA